MGEGLLGRADAPFAPGGLLSPRFFSFPDCDVSPMDLLRFGPRAIPTASMMGVGALRAVWDVAVTVAVTPVLAAGVVVSSTNHQLKSGKRRIWRGRCSHASEGRHGGGASPVREGTAAKSTQRSSEVVVWCGVEGRGDGGEAARGQDAADGRVGPAMAERTG